MIGTRVGFDKFLRRAARLDLIRSSHGGIVEEQDQIMALPVGLCHSFRAGRKTGNGLLLVVFIHLECILREVANVVAFFVGDDGVDQHQFCFFLDDHAGRFGGSSRLRRLGRRRGRLLLRTC